MKDDTIKFYSFKEFRSFMYERVISLRRGWTTFKQVCISNFPQVKVYDFIFLNVFCAMKRSYSVCCRSRRGVDFICGWPVGTVTTYSSHDSTWRTASRRSRSDQTILMSCIRAIYSWYKCIPGEWGTEPTLIDLNLTALSFVLVLKIWWNGWIGIRF